MPSFLVGSAYAVSSGLIIYGIAQEIIPTDERLKYLLIWAVAGLALAFISVVAAAVRRSAPVK
jgi:uncharacterized membrane protein YdbT with pleckstrin-like domain